MVAGAQRFCEYVLDSRGFHNGPDTTASDHSGSRGGRTQEDSSTSKFANNFMRNGILLNGNFDHRFPCRFRCLPNGLRYFVRLSKTVPDAPLMVSGNDQRTETETTPTLNDLGATVDKHDLLGGVAFL